MKSMLMLGVAGLVLATGCSSPRPKDHSRALFNGIDLAGWVVEHGGEWSVENGTLVGRNGQDWSTNPEVSGSWLRTAREYGDFLLELDFAIDGNSGIMLRSGTERNPSFNGYEMQVLSDQGRAGGRYPTGSLYDVIAASRNMSKPTGEWNHVRILAEGSLIQVVLNGELVVDYANATRRARGYIGLQNHDEKSVVRFRNIRITEL
ncbi:MAG: DUF1080 domain-containing protein [Verrucomicrobiales bacterium]|nr:DUF1080 domain-containing protein [Verrucomicrobiales bacterium]